MSDGPTFARFDPEPSNNNDNNNSPSERGNDNNAPGFDPWVTAVTEGGGNTPDFANTQGQAWRERERRQRSMRSFMMFLLLLTLMDGEEQSQQRRHRQYQAGLRGSKMENVRKRDIGSLSSEEFEMELYRARRTQDQSIENIVLNGNHSRVTRLIEKNKGRNIEREVRSWAEEQKNKQTMAIYEQLLKDLVLEQPDGSFMKVLVASKSNNDAVVVADDPSKVIKEFGDSATGNNAQGNEKKAQPMDEVEAAVKKFDEFQDAETEVWHYPWNATGYYRGDWKVIDSSISTTSPQVIGLRGSSKIQTKNSKQETASADELTPVKAEIPLLEFLGQQEDSAIGLHILPPGIKVKDPFNADDSSEASKRDIAFNIQGSARSPKSSPHQRRENISITKTAGKIAFQLYSKGAPAMKEISLIDGYMKIYDSSTVAYSTRRDILLRVRGVLVHSLGRLSMVANPRSLKNMALLVNKYEGRMGSIANKQRSNNHKKDWNITMSDETEKADGTLIHRRRLQELLSAPSDPNVVEARNFEEIRDLALHLFVEDMHDPIDLSSYKRVLSGADEQNEDEHMFHNEYLSSLNQPKMQAMNTTRRRMDEEYSGEHTSRTTGDHDIRNPMTEPIDKKNSPEPVVTQSVSSAFSKHVIPFPFVWDDQMESIQLSPPPASSKSLTQRETSLEVNAGLCEFQISMDVQEEVWTLGQWKRLMKKYVEQGMLGSVLGDRMTRNAANTHAAYEEGRIEVVDERKRPYRKGSRPSPVGESNIWRRASSEQAWIKTFNGTIVSPNCDFRAHVNATAIRTNWEATTGKAINYSFYMMGVCLIQVVLLLRQLLHTQGQFVATRVSILCIGWQTVVDALLCLVHIYLSLAMNPLFTAFASVAFFKLLIFCVIEMKYMAIIIQARNSSNGENSVELLRRQVAMLHLRFYVAMMGACLGFLYSDNCRTIFVLTLYSFWVPQIVHNVITEAKKPMHSYYIYGMSLSRLVAPLYMFAFQGNFLKEIYPESPTDLFLCRVLILWVGIQAGVLEAQSRFGARFFIPSQFLPPKYDYSRPIPESLLRSSEETTENPSELLQKDRETLKTEVRHIVQKRELNPRDGPRNRKEGNRIKGETGMTAETVTEVPKNHNVQCIDCVICYNEVDTSDRTAYMIAPCDHVFHKDCLIQWMEVKMECPICRKPLPPP